MSRPTRLSIIKSALTHNINQIKKRVPSKKIIAMVKANAYGCGIDAIIPTIEGHVDAFGVACIEEALAIRRIGSNKACILFQGIFTKDELQDVIKYQFEMVIHTPHQLEWLLSEKLLVPVKVWVKVNTGMNRLGFQPEEVKDIIHKLQSCKWVDKAIGLMTHLGYADDPSHPNNKQQIARFNTLKSLSENLVYSISNSAAIIAFPETNADYVRPGIMMYGVSPFKGQTGRALGLKPVMQLTSAISAIHHYPPHHPIGYGGIWQSDKDSIIGVIPVGYGDGYPRAVKKASVWIKGYHAPVVGRVSMDMLTIDLTNIPQVQVGDEVELWGAHMPIEEVAQASGLIPYELLSTITSRVR